MLVFGFLACHTTLTGEVRTREGAPVVGASLSSPGCAAVTDASGRFRVDCEPGTRTFLVEHPDHSPATWPVEVAGWGEQPVGAVEVVPIPGEPGLYLEDAGGFVAVPPGPFVRTVTTDERRWCMDSAAGAPVAVPAGTVRLLDIHAVDWRVYRLDADGCAYRMTPGGGSHWTWAADRVEVGPMTERGPGRDWVDLDLAPGDYALVEWYAGFLVRAPSGTERWSGSWLRASGTVPPAQQ